MRRLLILLLNISFLFSQSITKPDWVDNPPNDPKYYFGFGRAEIKGKSYSQYKEEADRMAFSDISTKILTAVSATSRYEAYEFNYDLTEEFSHEAETSTNTELEGLEPGGKPYKDDEYYYVYWKLSRVKYEKSVEKYQKRAQEYYKNSLYRLSLLNDKLLKHHPLQKKMHHFPSDPNQEIVHSYV